jgi:hypothetical protein
MKNALRLEGKEGRMSRWRAAAAAPAAAPGGGGRGKNPYYIYLLLDFFSLYNT